MISMYNTQQIWYDLICEYARGARSEISDTCNYIHISEASTYTVVSSYKESCNNKPMYGYMLPNLSPSPNLYKVQSV